MKHRRYAQDTFIVYSGDIVIATGTRERVAAQLRINEHTVSWYATPRAHQLFKEGKIRRMAVRINSRQTLEKCE